MTLFFHLKADTEQKFREAAMKKYGFTKGSLKTALEEAIGDWLEKQEQRGQSQPSESTPSKTESSRGAETTKTSSN